MTPEQLEQIEKTLEKTIERVVNGKIDRLKESFDNHVEEVKPIVSAYKGANTLGKFIIWLSKIALAVGIVVGAFIGAITYFK